MSVVKYWPFKTSFKGQPIFSFEELAKNPAPSQWKCVPDWILYNLPRPDEEDAWFPEVLCHLLDYQAEEGIVDDPGLFVASDTAHAAHSVFPNVDTDANTSTAMDTDSDTEIDILT